MKENNNTTENPLSTLSRMMTLKSRVITKEFEDIKTNMNSLKQLNIESKESQINEIIVPSNKEDAKQSQTLKKNIKLKKNRKNKVDKFNLDQIGRIEFAKDHSSANRPLNKLREFKSDQKFCKCCGLPCITPGVIEPFHLCDNTDKYSILGQAISLYFSFYKFSIFILIVLLCALIIPSFYMIYEYYYSLSNMCNDIISKNGNNVFIICENFITDKEYLNSKKKESKVNFQSQLNSVNLRSYVELYASLMSNSSLQNNEDISLNKEIFGKKINQLVINNSISYFIVLISLFIINLLYIIFQNNKILDYNFQLISPSDYAVIMTNLSYSCRAFRKMKTKYLRNNNTRGNIEFRMKLGFNENELEDNDITEAMEFGKYIENLIVNKSEKNKDENNKNKLYKVQLVNICYKLGRFKKLEEEIQTYKNQLFKVDNNPAQIKRNRHFKLEGNRRKYFKSPLSEINYFNLNTNCCEKRIPIIEIMRKKKHKENELNDLLEGSKFIRKSNFSNVAFISFDTISEQENFLNKYSKNWFQKFITFLRNLKYYFCLCFLSRESKRKWENENGESVSSAPEPDDIIFENLETTKFGRIIRTFITTLISFIIIAISFIIVVLLNLAQEKIDNMSFGGKNLSKYAVSLVMTGAISIVNIIFQGILESLTKLERHMSITHHNLSFSIKLTLFTFVNSAIVPLISNLFTNLKNLTINYELLVSNMLMMFLVNSLVSPLMWTFNIGFYIKKWHILKIESKKNPNMRHNMTQRELNELYEFVDIDLAYKYSYIAKTLLMTFFYLPLFPLGIVFSICGLFLGFYLEKYNIGHRYKRPEMMNETICKFYAHFFEVNFLVLALGDYIFLQEKYRIDYWPFINLAIFFILLIIPYGEYLSFNFIGKNQSQIINKNYDDVFFTFYNDYERINPFTRKMGTINYLKRLREKDYITEEEFENYKKQIEKLNFIQIIALAQSSKINRTKRSLGNKQLLLENLGLEESDNKIRRLFELIKKLYKMYEEENEDDDSYNYDMNIFNNNIISTSTHHNKKIPNILLLAGKIFGTEEDKDNTTTKLFFHENDISGKSFLNEKKYKRTLVFFGKQINKDKKKDISPIIINVKEENKITDNIHNNLNDNNKLIINKKTNNTNNTNLISNKKDFSKNKITSEINNENSRGGKNLINVKGYFVNDNNNYENIDENDNIIKINKINNETNYKKKDKKIPSLISNKSVTSNQFLEKSKNESKDESDYSDRIKNENKNNNKSEELIEEKKKEKKFVVNKTKIIPLTREEKEKMKSNENNGEIKNIINIALSDEKNISNNEDEEDEIYFNKNFNDKSQKKDNH